MPIQNHSQTDKDIDKYYLKDNMHYTADNTWPCCFSEPLNEMCFTQ